MGDRSEGERLSPVFSFFLCLIFLRGRSVIIVYSSAFSLSLLSRSSSLRATCMTVTMTAPGAGLLLLALCVCRGCAVHSAPRVRLSFKGELAPASKVPPTPSSDSCPPFPPSGGCVSSFSVRKDGVSCHMSNSPTLGTKGGCYVCLGTGKKGKTSLHTHPEPDTHHNLTCFMAEVMTQRGNT